MCIRDRAQSNLGYMYSTDQGVAQDYSRAHMWYHLASLSGDTNAAKNRDIIEIKMTPEQISEAQKMTLACQARHLKGCR